MPLRVAIDKQDSLALMETDSSLPQSLISTNRSPISTPTLPLPALQLMKAPVARKLT